MSRKLSLYEVSCRGVREGVGVANTAASSSDMFAYMPVGEQAGGDLSRRGGGQETKPNVWGVSGSGVRITMPPSNSSLSDERKADMTVRIAHDRGSVGAPMAIVLIASQGRATTYLIEVSSNGTPRASSIAVEQPPSQSPVREIDAQVPALGGGDYKLHGPSRPLMVMESDTNSAAVAGSRSNLLTSHPCAVQTWTFSLVQGEWKRDMKKWQSSCANHFFGGESMRDVTVTTCIVFNTQFFVEVLVDDHDSDSHDNDCNVTQSIRANSQQLHRNQHTLQTAWLRALQARILPRQCHCPPSSTAPRLLPPPSTHNILASGGTFIVVREPEFKSGAIRPNKGKILPNSLAGIPGGLEKLKAGQVSATKLVAQPWET
ncbi:hypothetical protein BC835DRAFT_1311478 [Cytidiella melzeri]|nr:hypothetical protein BC835DRAFT_1311478 [Cytidiella melzeri]